MHIPDGYLSPSTCLAFYAGSAPFWYVALRKVRRLLHTRLVPLLSIFSAFEFVIMMFNLPLPGGTSGHPIGVGIAAVVLGPWAAMLTVSIALLIQAIFFGDGGITAFGANCFNMAIAGSLAASGIYWAISGRAAITSPRRVAAAAIAGYAAINVAALLAAIEFGLQPRFFHDPTGAPLYAPYPLAIAVPAMMLGHLTFAGLAEAILAGGLVAYLQRTDSALLKLTTRDVSRLDERAVAEVERAGGWVATRRLWAALALVMLGTPLGLLAGGMGWGEWRAADLANPEMRREIAAASADQVPPERVPEGLARLSSLWSAPLSVSAPSFLRSPALSYVLSAMTGTGLIIAAFLLAAWLRDGRAKLDGRGERGRCGGP